ncbi:MAG: hypothetical protein IJH50_03900 [Kiritimatiellae bacterium]|nr:hypothetical protein [Kiritimatiellia bacterium]
MERKSVMHSAMHGLKGKGRLAFLAICLCGASVVMAAEVNLRTLAVTENGDLKIMRESESTEYWSANGTYTAPFDGDTSTAIDPRSAAYDTWVGYELTEPRVVTRIRVCGRLRGDGEARLSLCRIEGANEADFSDAITLLDLKDVVPVEWRATNPSGWFEAPARSFVTPKTFKYLRIFQPHVSGVNSFCGNVAELEFYGMDTESYADYTPTISKETNLRLYALHDSTGSLDIVSDKTEPWGPGYEYYKVFDGSIRTFYDPKDKDNSFNSYVGYALVAPMAITRIRYCGRGDGSANSSHTERLLYCKIEGANQADFSDAVTLHLCKNAVPLDWHLHPGWLDVVPDAAAGTNAFKYLRFIDYDGHHQCGDVSELEFYGMSADALAANVIANPQAATDLVATHGAYPEVPTELRWSVQPGVSASTILRAPGANGPWTEIAQLNGVNAYTDTTAPVGVLSYYRVVTDFTYDGQSVSATNETPTVFRRWRLLERNPESSMTQFRSGVKLIYTCGTGGNLCWTPSTGTTLTAVSNSLMIAFNNVLYKYSSAISEAGFAYYVDFADTKNAAPTRTCIGVDLGEPAHFAYLRFFSGIGESTKARLNGVVLSGSNSADWKESSNSTVLTTPLVWTAQAIWYEEASHDAENTYRYLFCHNPDNNEWNNNASELQFYGWFESDVAAAAQNVTDITATCGTTPSVTLTWTPVQYGTYTIERKVDGAEWQTMASGLSAATASWTDTSVTVGTRYVYRVTTVNGANVAYSADCSVRPYIAGNGIGLHGVWSAGYTSTNVGESVVSVTTNAVIDFKNIAVGGATENFFVRWTGRLIVPVAGDYLFDAEADDTVTLWIDSKPVLYRQSLDGTTQTAPGGALTLTAGEHDVVLTWFQADGENLCRLYWSGPVERAIIPASQLVPVPYALPEGWAGARTFNATASENNPGDVRFNGDGSIDLAYGGNDLYNGENGYCFLWQPFTGDFSCVARVDYLASLTAVSTAYKGGIMVRSALDAAAPFEACVIKMEGGHLKIGGKRCEARGQNPKDGGSYLDGASGWSERVSDNDTGCLLRIRRTGNVINYSYRKDNGSWKDVYRFEVSPDVYGDTVYVGLTSTSYIGYDYSRTPTYDWRFSGVKIRAPQGFAIFVR